MIPFERYDEEFASLTEQVTSKLRALDPRTTASSSSPSSSSADADVRMAHALLLQADDLLKQMGLEARGVEDASVKRDLLGKVSFFFGGGGGGLGALFVCVCVCVVFFGGRAVDAHRSLLSRPFLLERRRGGGEQRRRGGEEEDFILADELIGPPDNIISR
jgi:hypothetical protein